MDLKMELITYAIVASATKKTLHFLLQSQQY